MPRLELHLLGAPRIELDGSPISVDTRKAIALAAYLAVTGQPHTRERLATTFWPEADNAKAHAALRRTLSVLNKALAGVGLTIERDAISLPQTEEVWMDVSAFRAMLAARAGHGHPESEICPQCLDPLVQATALYHGDFMEGFTLRDSQDFDDWQFFQRETLQRELATALERQVVCYERANATEVAIAAARRWLALDPIHEPAHRQLMRLYDMAGERAAALRQYQECVRVLNAELGVPPLEETTALYEAIREQRVRASVQPSKPATVLTTPDENKSSLAIAPDRLPLVGRNAEWALLQDAYASTKDGGQWVAIEGEAGIGKTRLAEALLDEVRIQGGYAATARCYEGEALAYGAFVELLRTAFRKDGLAARLQPHDVAEAARLLPEAADLLPEPVIVPPLSSPGAQSRFFDGITQVLSGLDAPQPAVIFIDDVQWIDEASLDVLTYVVRRLAGRHLLVLVTWRGDQVPPTHRLRQLLAESQRSGRGQLISLERLSETVVGALVQQVLSNKSTPQLAERLYSETEGLPLFIAEYLAAIERDDADANWQVPQGVRGLLQSRLGQVSEAGRQLLSAASVVGRSFDLDTLQEVSGRSLDETVEGLERLVGLGVVREVGEGEGTLHYDFNHEKLRALMYDETSLTRRRLLHRRTAEALTAHARGPQSHAIPASQIAQHYRLSGQSTEASRFYKLAGDHARALYANADALTHYQSALGLGYSQPAELHEAIGDLQTLRGNYADALKAFEAAAALTGPDDLAPLEHKLGNVYARRGDATLAERHFEAALSAFGERTPGARSRVLADWSLTAHHQAQAELALDLARQSLDLAEEAGDAQALAQAHNILGILMASRKDDAGSRHHLEQSLKLGAQLGDVGAQVAALNNMALGLRANNKLDEAIELTQRALNLCASQGDRHREAALHNNLADLLHAAGRGEAAMSHLKKAVALFAHIGADANGAIDAEGLQWQPEIWKLTEW